MTVRPYDPADYVRGERVTFNYPEQIPEQVKGSPIIWPRSAHVGGLFNFHYSWNIDLIPAAYQDRLCYGNVPTNVDKHTGFERVRGVVTCAECEKPKVYNSHWCICCGNFFIKDFIDTRFCPAYPHCFNCLPQLSWTFCPDHALPDHVEFAQSGNTTLMLPAGFNPIEIDPAELEDFINNELGIF
jgi:hypothetical protein